MSKRSLDKVAEDGGIKPKQSKPGPQGLKVSMKNPKCVFKQTEKVVVIYDKYPKAKIHYLILPQENINSIYKLTSEHVPLLEEFNELYVELTKEHKDSELRAGFHAVPSMQRLHMHVISTDMISPFLKTKSHWNSFTTAFFKPYEDVLNELKNTGSIKKIHPELHKSLLASDMHCNQCSYSPKDMPDLKEHLITHCE